MNTEGRVVVVVYTQRWQYTISLVLKNSARRMGLRAQQVMEDGGRGEMLIQGGAEGKRASSLLPKKGGSKDHFTGEPPQGKLEALDSSLSLSDDLVP